MQSTVFFTAALSVQHERTIGGECSLFKNVGQDTLMTLTEIRAKTELIKTIQTSEGNLGFYSYAILSLLLS